MDADRPSEARRQLLVIANRTCPCAELHEEIASRFPAGRWGQPDDVANLVAFLVGDQGAWITGQVIDSEGGFRR